MVRRLLVNNADLDASSVPFPRERTYPAEYTEAIAANQRATQAGVRATYSKN